MLKARASKAGLELPDCLPGIVKILVQVFCPFYLLDRKIISAAIAISASCRLIGEWCRPTRKTRRSRGDVGLTREPWKQN